MNQKNQLPDILRDSALVVTGLTVVLFLWGYCYEVFRTGPQSAPGVLLPTVPVEDRLLTGGIIGVFLLFPLGIVATLVDRFTRNRMSAWMAHVWRRDLVHRAVLVVLLLAATVPAVRAVSVLIERFGSRQLRLETVVMKDGSPPPVPAGAYCLGKRGETYIFVDALNSPRTRIFMLREEDTSRLVLSYVRE